MYKVKHKLCPAYIRNIFKEPNSNYNLGQADFSIPRYKTVTYGKHSIRYLGPMDKTTQEYQGRHNPNVVQRQDTPTQYK